LLNARFGPRQATQTRQTDHHRGRSERRDHSQTTTVSIVGLEAPTKAAPIPEAKTTDKGLPYSRTCRWGATASRAEFPGFEMGLLRDFRVNRGDNKHVVVLTLEGLAESVTVGAANQAADRASRAFGLTVTQRQIQALSDDPDEMARS
jgi:hypothetical protein